MYHGAISIVGITLLLIPTATHGFNLQVPLEARRKATQAAKDNETRTTIRRYYGDPIHENMTLAALDCKEFETCQTEFENGPGLTAHNIRRGVRWNDNPTFRVNDSNLGCENVNLKLGAHFMSRPCYLPWITTWNRALTTGKRITAETHPPFPLIARVHFGDLQFLHAMAPAGEPASQTVKKLLTWAEFAYRMSLKEIRPRVLLTAIKRPAGFASIVGRKEWNAFTFVDYETNPDKAAGIAFGSLIHAIQDSFAGCHTVREEPNDQYKYGRIIQFLSYEKQNSSDHAVFDSSLHWNLFGKHDQRPVAAVRDLIKLRQAAAGWDSEVEPFLRIVFALENGSKKADGGGGRCE